MPPTASRRVVPLTNWRDTLLAFAIGAALLGLIACAVFSFSQAANPRGRVEGVIVAKHFVPRPETRITVGRDRLDSRQIDGEYRFEVRVSRENDRVYQVLVGKSDYEARQIGEPFLFYRE